jgi:hypothetical protein
VREPARRLLTVGAVVGIGVVAVRLAGPKLGQRMERMFEDAPEDFPPKWMYLNITAIRENTERILEALQPAPSETETDAV